MTQLLIIGLCVLVALLFMGRRIWRTLRKKSGCGCDCGHACKGAACAGFQLAQNAARTSSLQPLVPTAREEREKDSSKA